jgi:signal transduction histidine kinase
MSETIVKAACPCPADTVPDTRETDGPCGTPVGARCVDLESFYRAGRFLSSILNIEELLQAIVEEALSAVRGTRGFVGLVNRSTGDLELRIMAGKGWDQQPQRAIKITDEPGHGITVWVAATGVPYVSGDVRRDPHYAMFFPDVRSELAVPLLNRDGRTIGVLNVESEEIDAFDDRDLQLLGALANQASISISVANYRAREAALIEIGNELACSTDMDEVLECVVRRSSELLRADECSVFQLDATGGRLILRASDRMMQHQVGTLTYQLGEGLTGWVAQHAEVVRVANVREDPRWRGLYPELPAGSIESYLAVPVFHQAELWGVLRVVRRKPASSIVRNDFTERDEVLMKTLARQVGAAITQHSLVTQQLQMERMAAWGEMSARSAHMIGNKVFALKGQLNELEHLAAGRSLETRDVLEVVERAKRGVFQLEEVLMEFRDFLMATHLNLKPTDLNELVSATVSESFARHGSVSVSCDLAPGLPLIAADAGKLRRAISELLENAVNHQPEGAEIRIVTGRWGPEERRAHPALRFHNPRTDATEGVRLEVIDWGPGIPEENKNRLFTPFFTTRSKGMGLGLSIVKGIIDAHHGAIAEVGRPGEGARFLIVLPGQAADGKPD